MSDVPARVHYYDEQYLRPQDFLEEQAYHLAAQRRHAIGQHRWGIVTGLQVVVEERALWVQPGVAIDGFGREIVLPQRTRLSPTAFADKGSDTLEVWIAYERAGTEAAPAGYRACDEADGTNSFYRWQELPRVFLTVPDPAFTDRRHPDGVAPGDQDFAPYRDPPDDPARRFPVFLGQIERGAGPTDPPQTDPTGRPYVGLVGDRVVSASGRVEVQIGAQDEADPNRFAVWIPPRNLSGATPPRLTLRTDGTARVEGETTIRGDLTLSGAAEFGAGPRGGPDGPWRIRHVHDAAQDTHELRIVMQRPGVGGAAGTNQVVFGSWREPPDVTTPAFHPCLTVADDGTVTVHGNLVVSGQVIAQAVTAPQLTAEAQQFLASSLLTGVGGAGSLADDVFRGPFAPPPPSS